MTSLSTQNLKTINLWVFSPCMLLFLPIFSQMSDSNSHLTPTISSSSMSFFHIGKFPLKRKPSSPNQSPSQPIDIPIRDSSSPDNDIVKVMSNPLL